MRAQICVCYNMPSGWAGWGDGSTVRSHLPAVFQNADLCRLLDLRLDVPEALLRDELGEGGHQHILPECGESEASMRRAGAAASIAIAATMARRRRRFQDLMTNETDHSATGFRSTLSSPTSLMWDARNHGSRP